LAATLVRTETSSRMLAMSSSRMKREDAMDRECISDWGCGGA
jgi:hypothetical protein